MAQETDNEKAKWDLMRVDLALKRLQEYLANKTVDLDIKKLGVEIRLMEKHLEAAGIEVFIAGKTKWNVIEKARLDVVNAGLDAKLKEWEKKIAPEKLQLIKSTASKVYQDNMREWDKMSFEERRTKLSENLSDAQVDNMQINQILNTISLATGVISSTKK